MKIAILGAAGGIGQPLSLLLKLQLPLGSELTLYDIAPSTPGIAVDLSHIPTDVSVSGFCGENARPALIGADIVLLCAGVARKPGMDRSDLFKINAEIVQNLVTQIGETCPNACIGIITNPVNSTVPIAAEVLKHMRVYNKRKLFGVTTLDLIRTKTFVAAQKYKPLPTIHAPVIGGHSGTTILPLLSQIHGVTLTEDEVVQLTQRIRNAGTEVVEAKAGSGSATLSMAEAGALFTSALTKGLNGKDKVIICAYTESPNQQYAAFFARPLLIGHQGIIEYPEIGTLSQFEQSQLDAMLPILQKEIALGVDFIKQH